MKRWAKRWTDAEKAYLRARFHLDSIDAIAQVLGRTPYGVRDQAYQKMGLRAKRTKGLYTLADVARILGVHLTMAHRRVKAGQIRTVGDRFHKLVTHAEMERVKNLYRKQSPMPGWMTNAEVCAYLGYGKAMVSKLCKFGALHAIKVNGKYQIDAASVRKLAEKLRRSPRGCLAWDDLGPAMAAHKRAHSEAQRLYQQRKKCANKQ